MPIAVEIISDEQADKILSVEEGHFSDAKAIEIEPYRLTKTIAAFANADGGDLYIGIEEIGELKLRNWRGFSNPEAANGHLQAFEKFSPLSSDYSFEFLRSESKPGVVLHVHVQKTRAIARASDGKVYVRRGAQSLPIVADEALKRLEYSKGLVTFETELVNADLEAITRSEVAEQFVRTVVPSSTPEQWFRKQNLVRENRPTVAGILLFADEPQAFLPKQSGIKVYWYKTNEEEGFREALAFTPKTVEGDLYDQIKAAVALTAETVEAIPKMGDAALESIRYPSETLHEIITNAVIHRDYSIADDIHIRIFNNRIEVQSPGRLPAHVTVSNIRNERFHRNGSIVRILNKFPDPPNKDVGEGLRTAFEAMQNLGLKPPTIEERDNSVLVKIRHEPLAQPEQAILEYLETHETINNRQARKATLVRADYQMKALFNRMVEKGMIEQVPGTKTSNTAYRKPKADG
jgi:ATP-dependent DNA helicase RecG